ncbi:unnamed protein product [Amoebophrya sp. A25]|nr:unnamed protein product [Amoebophrya sp. A25]|eukprot:GSA25T00023958001.1
MSAVLEASPDASTVSALLDDVFSKDELQSSISAQKAAPNEEDTAASESLTELIYRLPRPLKRGEVMLEKSSPVVVSPIQPWKLVFNDDDALSSAEKKGWQKAATQVLCKGRKRDLHMPELGGSANAGSIHPTERRRDPRAFSQALANLTAAAGLKNQVPQLRHQEKRTHASNRSRVASCRYFNMQPQAILKRQAWQAAEKRRQCHVDLSEHSGFCGEADILRRSQSPALRQRGSPVHNCSSPVADNLVVCGEDNLNEDHLFRPELFKQPHDEQETLSTLVGQLCRDDLEGKTTPRTGASSGSEGSADAGLPPSCKKSEILEIASVLSENSSATMVARPEFQDKLVPFDDECGCVIIGDLAEDPYRFDLEFIDIGCTETAARFAQDRQKARDCIDGSPVRKQLEQSAKKWETSSAMWRKRRQRARWHHDSAGSEATSDDFASFGPFLA